MSTAHKKARTTESDVGFLKSKRGSNGMVDVKDKFHTCKTGERTHVVTPGDYQICACCRLKTLNISQHQNFQCPLSVCCTRLGDKFREACLYLLQRHKEHPAEWEHPGPFCMLKAELVAGFEDKMPVKVMDHQDESWNILLEIKRKQLFGHRNAVYEGHVGEILVDIGKQVSVKNPRACLWVLEQHDDQPLNEERPVRDWEMKHQHKNSNLEFTKEEQRQMECNRLALIKAMKTQGERNCLPWFFHEGGMTEKAVSDFAEVNKRRREQNKREYDSIFDVPTFNWLHLKNTP